MFLTSRAHQWTITMWQCDNYDNVRPFHISHIPNASSVLQCDNYNIVRQSQLSCISTPFSLGDQFVSVSIIIHRKSVLKVNTHSGNSIRSFHASPICSLRSQYRHLIPALYAWAARASYTTARPIAIQFPKHGCMDDVSTERSFDSQATWFLDVLQPSTGRRPVDWCRNKMFSPSWFSLPFSQLQPNGLEIACS